ALRPGRPPARPGPARDRGVGARRAALDAPRSRPRALSAGARGALRAGRPAPRGHPPDPGGGAMRRRVTGLTLAVWLAIIPAARPQGCAARAPAGTPGTAALLEHGLPAAPVVWAATVLAIRWDGLAELDTRSAAATIGWRSARAAVGVSQTGEGEIGW